MVPEVFASESCKGTSHNSFYKTRGTLGVCYIPCRKGSHILTASQERSRRKDSSLKSLTAQELGLEGGQNARPVSRDGLYKYRAFNLMFGPRLTARVLLVAQQIAAKGCLASSCHNSQSKEPLRSLFSPKHLGNYNKKMGAGTCVDISFSQGCSLHDQIPALPKNCFFFPVSKIPSTVPKAVVGEVLPLAFVYQKQQSTLVLWSSRST